VFPWVAAAFLLHACVAVAAGALLTLLPREPREILSGALFLIGAALVLRHADNHTDGDAARTQPHPRSGGQPGQLRRHLRGRVGDITQTVTANLA
jgi:putative Ca2+/H+ antiporter (TMEM165/GDT1 family)